MQSNAQKSEIRIPPPEVPDCFICMDKGFIIVHEASSAKELITYCVCPKGEKYQYDGRKRDKNPTAFYIPCISEMTDHIGLAEANYKYFVKNYAHHPEVKRVLDMRRKEVS